MPGAADRLIGSGEVEMSIGVVLDGRSTALVVAAWATAKHANNSKVNAKAIIKIKLMYLLLTMTTIPFKTFIHPSLHKDVHKQ